VALRQPDLHRRQEIFFGKDQLRDDAKITRDEARRIAVKIAKPAGCCSGKPPT
jgi:hypothetical protein